MASARHQSDTQVTLWAFLLGREIDSLPVIRGRKKGGFGWEGVGGSEA